MLRLLLFEKPFHLRFTNYLLGGILVCTAVITFFSPHPFWIFVQGTCGAVITWMISRFTVSKPRTASILLPVSLALQLGFRFFYASDVLAWIFAFIIIFQAVLYVKNSRNAYILITLAIALTFTGSLIYGESLAHGLGQAVLSACFALITVQAHRYCSAMLEPTKENTSGDDDDPEDVKQFFRKLLDGSACAIIAIDVNGLIREFNLSACQMLEYHAEDVIGKSIITLLHDQEELEKRTKSINERYHAGIEKGILTLTYKNKIGLPNSNEWTYITRTGRRISVLLTVTSIKNSQGRVIGHNVVAHDLTQIKYFEEQKHTAEAIIANSPSVLFKWLPDEDWTVQYVSANVVQLLGYSSIDFSTKKVRYAELIVEQDRLMVAANTNQAQLDEKENLELEYRLKHKSGKIIWVREQAHLRRNEQGQVEHYEGVLTDITQNKKAKEDLLASELRYELAARGTAAGLWDWQDITKPDIWLSPKLFELLGYKPHQLGTTIDELRKIIHPEDHPKAVTILNKHLEDDTPYLSEIRLRTKRGTYKWFQTSGQVHRDEQGKPIRLVGSIIDIDHKKRNEDLLRLSEERFRLFIESARDLFYNTNLRGKFTYANEMAVHITEYSVEEILQMHYYDLVRPDYQQEVIAFYKNQLRSSTRVSYLEFPIITKSGKIKWLGQNVQFLYEGERLKSTQAIARDITDLKMTQQHLQDYTLTLERTNKELDEFSYVVSHDLKAPLRGITYLADWIREEQMPHLTQESRDNFDLLKNRVAKMEQFIEGLLEYSKAGRRVAKTKQIQLKRFLSDLVQLLHIPPGVKTSLRVVDLEFETDTIPLEQVLGNLISNAVKYNTNSQPTLEISCEKQDNKLVFCVIDNGPGIEKQYHTQIFKIFHSIGVNENTEGTGIGLAIVKKILEERNEFIILESEPGKGSKFSFTWNIT